MARRRIGSGPLSFSSAALAELCAAQWPGNVRELENVVGRAALRAAFGRSPDESCTIEPEHLGLHVPAGAAQPAAVLERVPLRERMTAFQRQAVLEALERQRWAWADAARELGMDRSNLYHLAQRLGISRRK